MPQSTGAATPDAHEITSLFKRFAEPQRHFRATLAHRGQNLNTAAVTLLTDGTGRSKVEGQELSEPSLLREGCEPGKQLR